MSQFVQFYTQIDSLFKKFNNKLLLVLATHHHENVFFCLFSHTSTTFSYHKVIITLINHKHKQLKEAMKGKSEGSQYLANLSCKMGWKSPWIKFFQGYTLEIEPCPQMILGSSDNFSLHRLESFRFDAKAPWFVHRTEQKS